MNHIRRQTLRNIMNLAWSLYRAELGGPSPRTFSDALAGAWRWTKAAAARIAEAPTWAKGRKSRVSFAPLVQSPIGRSLTGARFAGVHVAGAGYTTSRLGR